MKPVLSFVFITIFLCKPVFANNTPFGLHGVSANVGAVSELGIKQIRAAGLFWDMFEPRKGVYKLRKLDKRLKKVQKTKIGLIIATIRPISRWGGNLNAQKGMQRDKPATSMSGYPSNIDAWRKFVNILVERYDGDGKNDMPGLKTPVKYWQIEGEWMWQWKDKKENYIKFLKITSEVIRKADPEAKIIGGGLTGLSYLAVAGGIAEEDYLERGMDTDTTRKIFAKNFIHSPKFLKLKEKAEYFLSKTKDYFDIVDFHSYTMNASIIAGQVKWIKKTMRKSGYSKPIWSLENGGPFYGYTLSKHSSEVVKRHVVSLASGVEKIFWSSLSPTLGWSENFLRLSLIDQKGRKKPAFYTYKLMVSKLDGYTNLETIKLDAGVSAYRFTVEGKPVYVLWSKRGTRSVKISVDSPQAKITHLIVEEGRVEPKIEIVKTDKKILH